MTSTNKKNKAKNSYIRNGSEGQKGIKQKRIHYYTKANRAHNKKIDENLGQRCCFKDE